MWRWSFSSSGLIQLIIYGLHTHTHNCSRESQKQLEAASDKVISFWNRFSDTPYINDKIFCFGCNKNRAQKLYVEPHPVHSPFRPPFSVVRTVFYSPNFWFFATSFSMHTWIYFHVTAVVFSLVRIDFAKVSSASEKCSVNGVLLCTTVVSTVS